MTTSKSSEEQEYWKISTKQKKNKLLKIKGKQEILKAVKIKFFVIKTDI